MENSSGDHSHRNSGHKVSRTTRGRRRKGPRGLFRRFTAVAAALTLFLAGAAAGAQAAPGDASASNAQFLSGTLLTSAGTLNSIATLNGASAANPGNPTPVINNAPLSVTALNAVTLNAGAGIPLFGNTGLINLGAVNQYAAAFNSGVSNAASGAVGNTGAVSVNGAGAFPANASINLAPLLSAVGGSSVFDTAQINLGAVTGVAALTAPGPPATSCTNLSAPVNCRDYNIASATLNLHSAAVGNLTGQLNTAVNGPVSTLTNTATTQLTTAVTNAVNAALAPITGLGVTQNVTVNLGINVPGALAPVLATPITQNGVTLNPSTGTITVDLAQVTGALNGRAPNSNVLDASTINIISNTLFGPTGILNTLQTNIDNAVTAAVNNATVTVSDSVALRAPITGTSLGTLGVTVGGPTTTLGSLAAGTAPPVTLNTSALNDPTGILNPVLGTLANTVSTTLAGTLPGLLTPTITNGITAIDAAVNPLIQGLATTLQPALTAIGSLAQVTLNVQEPGTSGYTYKEVGARVSLIGANLGTVDLGMAQVGPNVLAPVVPGALTLTPNQGPVAGGQTVTITGTGLAGATAVQFGGTTLTPGTVADATHFVANPDGSITVSTPAAAAAGPVNVTVTTPGGTSPAGTYTYVAAPGALTLTPNQGPLAGGQTVTITGTGLAGATSVQFGGTTLTPGTVADATHFVANPDGSITVSTPAAAAAGPVNVTVTTPGGTSPAGTYTYVAAPGALTLTPNQGPLAGGQTVTITGPDLMGATSVLFGGTTLTPGTVADATHFVVNPDGSISLITPAAAAAGPVDVTVTTPSGTSPAAPYTYVAAPGALALSPNQGPVTGGQTVTITGPNLAGATAVQFGGATLTPGTVADATHFVANPDGSITVFTPPTATPGPVNVTVTTPGGTSPAATFTYQAVAPGALTLSPPQGPAAGGQTVTITGTALAGATAVRFGRAMLIPGTVADATHFVANADGSITVSTPAAAAGPANVTVTTPSGTSPASSYVYLAAPGALTLSPNQGPLAGGQTVTITGPNLMGATSVLFGGTTLTPGTVADATHFVVNPDGSISLITPAAAAAGPVDVTVTTPSGTSPVAVYTYAAALAVTGQSSPAADQGSDRGLNVQTAVGKQMGSILTSGALFVLGGLTLAGFVYYVSVRRSRRH